MSFDIYSKRPKLVEPKLLKYYNDMNKEVEMKEMALKQEMEKKEVEMKEDTFSNKILECIKNFVIENYGFVILFTLISLLLYVRYIEVKRKKEKIKQLLEQQELNKDANNKNLDIAI